MAQYFIGLTLPPELESKVKEISLLLDPNYTRETPLHITIKPPFRMDEAQVELLMDRINELTVNFSHKSLVIKELGSFPFNQKNLHLKIEKTAWLENLYDKVKDFYNKIIGFADHNKGKKFVPHITISEVSSDPVISERAQSILQEILGMQFYPYSLDLFKIREDRSKDPRRWGSFQKFEFPRTII